jgi:hypothetical protein
MPFGELDMRKLVVLALLAPVLLVGCKAHVRGVVMFVGDSNVVLGAHVLTERLSDRDDGYLPVFNAHIGAAIREPDCRRLGPCETNDFWRIRLGEAARKIETDVYVVDLGGNDMFAPGTTTSKGYAGYNSKID